MVYYNRNREQITLESAHRACGAHGSKHDAVLRVSPLPEPTLELRTNWQMKAHQTADPKPQGRCYHVRGFGFKLQGSQQKTLGARVQIPNVNSEAPAPKP